MIINFNIWYLKQDFKIEIVSIKLTLWYADKRKQTMQKLSKKLENEATMLTKCD